MIRNKPFKINQLKPKHQLHLKHSQQHFPPTEANIYRDSDCFIDSNNIKTS